MYIIISTQIRYENGPTRCGDQFSDAQLMSSLGAVSIKGEINLYLYTILSLDFEINMVKLKTGKSVIFKIIKGFTEKVIFLPF